jgi:hypothetical protein
VDAAAEEGGTGTDDVIGKASIGFELIFGPRFAENFSANEAGCPRLRRHDPAIFRYSQLFE